VLADSNTVEIEARDKNQQIIAKGNVLASLIPRAAGS
jgi:hypothetical protein